MALKRGEYGAKKGDHFLVWCKKKRRVTFFRPQKNVLTFNRIHYPYFCPKVNVQTGEASSRCYDEEIEQYFA